MAMTYEAPDPARRRLVPLQSFLAGPPLQIAGGADPLPPPRSAMTATELDDTPPAGLPLPDLATRSESGVVRVVPSVTAGAAAIPDTEPASLVATDISAWFSKRKVLERCSLAMQAHRVTALIGPSGCGKSTFLRILNRMHEVIRGAEVAGSVELDGTDVYGDGSSVTDVRMKIGMVFQKPNPFPSMTIRENVLAGLKLSGTSTGDADALVESSLRRAGLWDEVKDRLKDGGMSLSGGQQQRLCIARALAVRPRVLLMDEPCSALDPISTRVVEETITELAHEITIVIVTHNMQQAQRVSDDCAFFMIERQGDPGRIVESGPTQELFTDPHDQRTLDYVTGRFG